MGRSRTVLVSRRLRTCSASGLHPVCLVPRPRIELVYSEEEGFTGPRASQRSRLDVLRDEDGNRTRVVPGVKTPSPLTSRATSP